MLKSEWGSFKIHPMAATAIMPALLFVPVIPTDVSPFVSNAAAQLTTVDISQAFPAQTADQATPLDAFMQIFNQRRRQREGIRRSGFCVLSPSVIETDIIWSDQPLFLWRGAANQITLAKFGSSEPFWSQAIEPQTQQVCYSGEALQPGEIYQWRLLGDSGTETSLIFQVMELAQRSQIEIQLQMMATQQPSSDVGLEAIALQQVQYFADQNLWSDALQLLYSINNPSPQTTAAIQQIEENLCGS
jgi:Domain of Unknown Function (DUF928)